MKSASKSRFVVIDGFRGLAALAVVFYHLHLNLEQPLSMVLPSFVSQIFSYGYLGVPVFFVISGFVISYAIGSVDISKEYFLNFVLRRSIRLDLTYWASMFMAIILLVVRQAFIDVDTVIPSFSCIFLHMFYLQDLAQVDPVISGVYWTLCLEVQFYLFFILSFWWVQIVAPKHIAQGAHLAVCFFIALYSLAMDIGLVEELYRGLFIAKWHYFFIGYLTSSLVRKVARSQFYYILWLVVGCVAIAHNPKPYLIAAVSFSVMLVFIIYTGVFNSLFSTKILLYLGSISYPLYLVHPDVGWKAISLSKSVLGGEFQDWVSLPIMLVGVVVSLLVAHIFHLLFEKPCILVAENMKALPLKDSVCKVLGRYRWGRAS